MLGVGVIGAGRMGLSHAEAYAQLEDVTLVGVADVDIARAKEVATTFRTEAHQDYMALLQSPDLNAVSICTPDRLHVEPILSAARLGKDILVEKPLAATLRDCDTIISACEHNHVTLMVGHILRFDPRYVKVQEAVAQGGLGNVIHVFAQRNDVAANARYYKSRTTLPLYLGVHDIDVVMWILGGRPDTVYAVDSNTLLPEYEGADSVMCVFTFPGNIVVSLGLSWTVPAGMPAPRASLEVVGTRGMALVSVYDQGIGVCTGADLKYPDVSYRPLVHGRLAGILVEEIRHFVSTVRRRGKPLVSGTDGRAAVKVALAIGHALAAKKPVTIDWSQE